MTNLPCKNVLNKNFNYMTLMLIVIFISKTRMHFFLFCSLSVFIRMSNKIISKQVTIHALVFGLTRELRLRCGEFCSSS